MALSDKEEEEIKQIIQSLEIYELGDIKKSLKQDMLIASFILCACFIEVMVQYRYYKDSGWERGDSEKFWGEFVDTYFPAEYKGMGGTFCKHLRHKTVHNYSGNGYYALGEYTSAGKAKHLMPLPNGKIFLSINSFVIAVDHAFYAYKEVLQKDENLKRLAIQRADKTPILRQE